MRFAFRLLGLLVLVVAGCSRPDLDTTARQVRVVQEPMSRCERLGTVRGESGGAGGIYISDAKLIEYAKNDLLNRAAKRGATHVLPKQPQLDALDGVTHRGIVEGTAYRCGAGAKSVKTAVEARIRAALEERAANILACVGTDRVGVRVRYAPGKPLGIALQGDLEGSPEQECVAAELTGVRIDTERAKGTVVRVVRLPADPPEEPPEPERTPAADDGASHDGDTDGGVSDGGASDAGVMDGSAPSDGQAD